MQDYVFLRKSIKRVVLPFVVGPCWSWTLTPSLSVEWPLSRWAESLILISSPANKKWNTYFCLHHWLNPTYCDSVVNKTFYLVINTQQFWLSKPVSLTFPHTKSILVNKVSKCYQLSRITVVLLCLSADHTCLKSSNGPDRTVRWKNKTYWRDRHRIRNNLTKLFLLNDYTRKAPRFGFSMLSVECGSFWKDRGEPSSLRLKLRTAFTKRDSLCDSFKWIILVVKMLC